MPRKAKLPGKRMMTVVFECPEEWRINVPEMIRALATKSVPVDLPVDLNALLGKIEALYIERALSEADGNRQKAAELVGMNRTTLVEKLRRAGKKGKTR